MPLISIVKLVYGNIGSKGNTRCMRNDSKLSNILPKLPSKCQYLVCLPSQIKDSSISLKSIKLNEEKCKTYLELLSKTVDYVWKITTNFNLIIYQAL